MCSFLGFISRYPATRRQRTAQDKTFSISNRMPTGTSMCRVCDVTSICIYLSIKHSHRRIAWRLSAFANIDCLFYQCWTNHFSSPTSLLKTLHACVDRGKNPIAPLWHHRLKTEWWSKVVTYFLYASSCGSLDIVKYFIDSGQKPNIRYVNWSLFCITNI